LRISSTAGADRLDCRPKGLKSRFNELPLFLLEGDGQPLIDVI
jgi:hypothetical protein